MLLIQLLCRVPFPFTFLCLLVLLPMESRTQKTISQIISSLDGGKFLEAVIPAADASGVLGKEMRNSCCCSLYSCRHYHFLLHTSFLAYIPTHHSQNSCCFYPGFDLFNNNILSKILVIFAMFLSHLISLVLLLLPLSSQADFFSPL